MSLAKKTISRLKALPERDMTLKQYTRVQRDIGQLIVLAQLETMKLSHQQSRTFYNKTVEIGDRYA